MTNYKQKPVLNHLCAGLDAFQAQSQFSGCRPLIYDDGTIAGCDDANQILINFCPFCGAKLQDEPGSYPQPEDTWETEDD